jgi:hypothetical protein
MTKVQNYITVSTKNLQMMVIKMIMMLVAGLLTLCTSACTGDDIVIGPYDPTPLPTALSTVPELITSLSNPDYRVRLSSIYALGNMGASAEPAIPALIIALSDDIGDVRIASTYALGKIGPAAASAVPTLVQVLRSNKYEAEAVAAAKSLGEIGDVSAVPALADVLFDQNAHISLCIEASRAIARLTGVQFPDSEPESRGYKLDDEGKPLLVIAAQEWWESEGRYMEWYDAGSDE